MPERPPLIKDRIAHYINRNVPHFFKYAKDKDDHQVSEINNSFVNKLNGMIPNPRINCCKLGLEKIDYTLLMHDKDIECRVQFTDKGKLIKEATDPLIVKYHELSKKYFLSFDNVLKMEQNFSPNILINSQVRQNLKYNNLVKEIKSELSQTGYSDVKIADILVKYLYGVRESKRKLMLWMCYGDCIYENLQSRLKLQTKVIQCVDCGEWFDVDIFDSATCRCNICTIEHKRELTRLRVKRHRTKQCNATL